MLANNQNKKQIRKPAMKFHQERERSTEASKHFRGDGSQDKYKFPNSKYR